MKRAILLSVLVPLMALAENPAQTSTTPEAAASSQPAPAAAPASAPAKPNPLANAVQARTPEEQANQSGFQVATTLDHYLGAGTFVDARYYSSLSAFLTIAPQFLFGIGKQRLVASATIRASYEYTLPDTDTGRRWGIYDIRLGVSAPALFKEKALTNIAFSPSLGLAIPTSLESWNAGLITSISLGVTASRSVGTFDFRASLSGSRSIYGQAASGYRNPDIKGTGAATAPRDTNGNLLAICRVGETLCASAGMNPAWSFSVGGQVQWRATGSVLFYVGYSYIRSWRNGFEPDDYTAQTLDSNGNRAAKDGLGNGDRTSTYFGGSYQLNEHYSLDLGVSTIQTPLTPTGQVRFPFLSVGTWADNGTSIYFTLSAAY